MGGTDIHNVTCKVIEACNKLPNVNNINVVIGSAYKHIEPLKKQLKRDVNKYDAPTLELNNSYVVDAGDNGERFFKDIFSYTLDDIKITNYKSYPTIKMKLSN